MSSRSGLKFLWDEVAEQYKVINRFEGVTEGYVTFEHPEPLFVASDSCMLYVWEMMEIVNFMWRKHKESKS